MNVMKRSASVLFAVAALACLMLFAMPARAFASTTGTVSCDNGWVLNYEIGDDGNATIAGVDTAGDGLLTIPETIEGATVTAIGYIDKDHLDTKTYKYGFYSAAGSLTSISIPDTVTLIGDDVFRMCKNLTSIDLPDNLVTLGVCAFCFSGITSIDLPAGLQEVGYATFLKCTSLETVTFEGDTMQYIGESAFMGCVKVKEFSIPYLTSLPGTKSPDTLYGCSAATSLIGQRAFKDCSSMETLEFLAPSADILVPTYIPNAGLLNQSYSNSNIVDGCSSFTNIVWHSKISSHDNGNGNIVLKADNIYCTIDFYGSAADASAHENKLGSVTYKTTTPIMDILDGQASPMLSWKGECEVPECPEGYTWGIGYAVDDDGLEAPENPVIYTDSTLDNSYVAIPVSTSNMNYGFITSRKIEDEYVARSMNSDATYATYYIDPETGVADIFDLQVRSADGTVLTKGEDYYLYIEKGTRQPDSFNNRYSYTYEAATAFDTATRYRITAYGVGDYSDTCTNSVYVEVKDYEQTLLKYTGSTLAPLYEAITEVGGDFKNTESRSVIVPADNWQYSVLGSAIAGLFDGIVIPDDGSASGTANYTAAFTAYNAVASSNVMVLGTYSKTKTSNTQILRNLTAEGSTDYGCLLDGLTTIKGSALNLSNLSADTVQELAIMVYEKVASKWSAIWGTTAVILSPKGDGLNAAVEPYVYENHCPVFYLNDDGTLSDDLVSVLQNAGFYRVVVVGDTSLVSDKSLNAVSAAAGVTAERVCGAASNSIDLAKALGDGVARYNMVVAAASSADAVNAAALLSIDQTSSLFVVSGASDVEAIRSYMSDMIDAYGRTCINSITFVGDFDAVYPQAISAIASLWDSGAWIDNDNGTKSFRIGGSLVTGVYAIDGVSYGFDDSGILVTDGWVKSGSSWYYTDANGKVKTGWQKISGKYYYFDASGVMLSGWQKISGKWYYLKSGAMVIGWQKISGKYYYFNGSGVMLTGWQKISGKWYYLKSGVMVTGWQKLSGKYYYFNGSGVMLTGWQKISGKYYYLKSGVMLTGWQKISGKTYYFNASGQMVTGKVKISGKYYTFSSAGVWNGKAGTTK